jgi:hypothetical protein
MLDVGPNCGNPAVVNLGLLGWIAAEELPGTTPIYRCHDPSTWDHFVSTSPSCDGKTYEWPIGYLFIQPQAMGTPAFRPWVYLPWLAR